MRWTTLCALGLALLGAAGCADSEEPEETITDTATPQPKLDGGTPLCSQACERVQCGMDLCGNNCGECGVGSECQQGICVALCTPQCDGKQCGEDGCGGQCGQCGAEQSCVGGVCETPCQASCDGKQCGDNGCGGVCPPGCGGGEVCLEDATCCAPACDGKVCGDDGCGGVCGQCGVGEVCDEGACRVSCVPSCEGRACGDNGCGGLCGECDPGAGCVDGACVADCVPDCAGRECGEDGCGGSCGQCNQGSCQDGACVGACVPDCDGRECGDNGCGDPCGQCGVGAECDEGQCEALCTPNCDGRACGDNGCGGVCPPGCGMGEACDDSGTCVAACVPNCVDRACGDDGCGGNCGLCGEGEQCDGAACVSLCTPNCDGRACGDNGCGGACGDCDAGTQCADGACVAEAQLVSWCRLQWPSDISLAPGDVFAVYARVNQPGITDRTNGNDPDPSLQLELGYGPDGADPSTWTSWLAASPNPEWVDDLEPGNDEYMTELGAPAQAGTYDMAFRATLDDGGHYIYCDLPAGMGRDGSEDGYSPSNAASLFVGCTPECAGLFCGDDGCGGSCGDCPEGSTCEEGACVAPCVPDCDGVVCGGDGCGGSCGECDLGQSCVEGACVAGDDPGVEWCRFQYPGEITVVGGDELTVYGHIHVTGLTDLTGGPDADPNLVVEAGFGPTDAHPQDWTDWMAATANPDFSGVGSDANDEYMATFNAPGQAGAYSMAFRATRTGQGYLFCDLNRGFGADGSNDGYALEDAARLNVEGGCVPDCAGLFCGDDGCGGSCGACPEGAFCSEGACVDECTPDCAGKTCGNDGCGGSCGSCLDSQSCVENQCVDECVPDCAGKVCGDDGCGGLCGQCDADQSCVEFQCVAGCVPECGDRVCGDNGCGGLCGQCDLGDVCDAQGACVDPLEGAWCRYQWPTNQQSAAGGAFQAYMRIYIPGVTDQSGATDPVEGLNIDHIVLAQGGDPATEALLTVAAAPNAGWSDGAAPGNDEYVAEVVAPAEAGSYDMAFAVYFDAAHKLLCDTSAGLGADGSEDGYQAANAAQLTVE